MDTKRTVRDFEFAFIYGGKQVKAICSEMIGFAKVPMMRVSVHVTNKRSEVYVFYKTDKEQLFWFDLPQQRKQNMAKKLSQILVQ